MRAQIINGTAGIPLPFFGQVVGSFTPIGSKRDEIIRCHCKCHSQGEATESVCKCGCNAAPCGIPVPSGCMMSHEANCINCKTIAFDNCT